MRFLRDLFLLNAHFLRDHLMKLAFLPQSYDEISVFRDLLTILSFESIWSFEVLFAVVEWNCVLFAIFRWNLHFIRDFLNKFVFYTRSFDKIYFFYAILWWNPRFLRNVLTKYPFSSRSSGETRVFSFDEICIFRDYMTIFVFFGDPNLKFAIYSW